MSLESDIALLKGIPLFSALASEQLRLIAFSAVRMELAQGQVLFRKGTLAQSGFVVLSGKVQLTAREDGQPMMCESGALIGEMALLVESRRPVTATAVATGEVMEIERKAMLRMLNEYPAAAAQMRLLLAQRLSATVREFSRLHTAFGPGLVPGRGS